MKGASAVLVIKSCTIAHCHAEASADAVSAHALLALPTCATLHWKWILHQERRGTRTKGGTG